MRPFHCYNRKLSHFYNTFFIKFIKFVWCIKVHLYTWNNWPFLESFFMHFCLANSKEIERVSQSWNPKNWKSWVLKSKEIGKIASESLVISAQSTPREKKEFSDQIYTKEISYFKANFMEALMYFSVFFQPIIAL